MKKAIVALLCICVVFSTSSFAADPCKVTICMMGKVTGGNGGKDCDGAEKSFFNILKWKHGNIKWSKTANARKNFLNGCPNANPADITKIIIKFGRVRG